MRKQKNIVMTFKWKQLKRLIQKKRIKKTKGKSWNSALIVRKKYSRLIIKRDKNNILLSIFEKKTSYFSQLRKCILTFTRNGIWLPVKIRNHFFWFFVYNENNAAGGRTCILNKLQRKGNLIFMVFGWNCRLNELKRTFLVDNERKLWSKHQNYIRTGN